MNAASHDCRTRTAPEELHSGTGNSSIIGEANSSAHIQVSLTTPIPRRVIELERGEFPCAPKSPNRCMVNRILRCWPDPPSLEVDGDPQ